MNDMTTALDLNQLDATARAFGEALTSDDEADLVLIVSLVSVKVGEAAGSADLARLIELRGQLQRLGNRIRRLYPAVNFDRLEPLLQSLDRTLAESIDHAGVTAADHKAQQHAATLKDKIVEQLASGAKPSADLISALNVNPAQVSRAMRLLCETGVVTPAPPRGDRRHAWWQLAKTKGVGAEARLQQLRVDKDNVELVVEARNAAKLLKGLRRLEGKPIGRITLVSDGTMVIGQHGIGTSDTHAVAESSEFGHKTVLVKQISPTKPEDHRAQTRRS